MDRISELLNKLIETDVQQSQMDQVFDKVIISIIEKYVVLCFRCNRYTKPLFSYMYRSDLCVKCHEDEKAKVEIRGRSSY
jgi:hypothetical protein